MRRDFLVGIGLLASVAAGAGTAVAADIPARPAVAPPPVASPAFVPDWVGFYVGINGGGGSARTTFEQSFFENDRTIFSTPDQRASGGVFGFQWGHNWQWGPVVGGLEIDFDGASIKETNNFFFNNFFFTGDGQTFFTHEFKIDELASARGRLGYLIFPNWLLYGTAGIGWAHTRSTMTLTHTPNPFTSIGTLFETQTSDANEFGWVAGVGLEWKFWPGNSAWLLRGEWLHYDFGRTSQFDLIGFPDNTRTTVDIGRAALSYKF